MAHVTTIDNGALPDVGSFKELSTALQTAVDASVVSQPLGPNVDPVEVIIPDGNYVCSVPVKVRRNYVTIRGQYKDPYATKITPGGPFAPIDFGLSPAVGVTPTQDFITYGYDTPWALGPDARYAWKGCPHLTIDVKVTQMNGSWAQNAPVCGMVWGPDFTYVHPWRAYLFAWHDILYGFHFEFRTTDGYRRRLVVDLDAYTNGTDFYITFAVDFQAGTARAWVNGNSEPVVTTDANYGWSGGNLEMGENYGAPFVVGAAGPYVQFDSTTYSYPAVTVNALRLRDLYANAAADDPGSGNYSADSDTIAAMYISNPPQYASRGGSGYGYTGTVNGYNFVPALYCSLRDLTLGSINGNVPLSYGARLALGHCTDFVGQNLVLCLGSHGYLGARNGVRRYPIILRDCYGLNNSRSCVHADYEYLQLQNFQPRYPSRYGVFAHLTRLEMMGGTILHAPDTGNGEPLDAAVVLSACKTAIIQNYELNYEGGGPQKAGVVVWPGAEWRGGGTVEIVNCDFGTADNDTPTVLCEPGPWLAAVPTSESNQSGWPVAAGPRGFIQVRGGGGIRAQVAAGPALVRNDAPDFFDVEISKAVMRHPNAAGPAITTAPTLAALQALLTSLGAVDLTNGGTLTTGDYGALTVFIRAAAISHNPILFSSAVPDTANNLHNTTSGAWQLNGRDAFTVLPCRVSSIRDTTHAVRFASKHLTAWVDGVLVEQTNTVSSTVRVSAPAAGADALKVIAIGAVVSDNDLLSIMAGLRRLT